MSPTEPDHKVQWPVKRRSWLSELAALKPRKFILASHASASTVRDVAKMLGIKIKTRATGRRDETTLTSEVRVFLADEPEPVKQSLRAQKAKEAEKRRKQNGGRPSLMDRDPREEEHYRKCVPSENNPGFPAKPKEWIRALAALKPGEFLLADDKRLASVRRAVGKLGLKVAARRTGLINPQTCSAETRVFLRYQPDISKRRAKPMKRKR